MDIGYLIFLAIIAAVFILMSKRKSRKDSNDIVEKCIVDAERVIVVEGISEVELENTISDIINLYDLGEENRPTVERMGSGCRMKMSKNENLISMCYWVNFLAYCDEKKKIVYNVNGWYTLGDVEVNGEVLPISHKTVMIYIPKDDKRYDIVNIISQDNYSYCFQLGGNLEPILESAARYQAMP